MLKLSQVRCTRINLNFSTRSNASTVGDNELTDVASWLIAFVITSEMFWSFSVLKIIVNWVIDI